MRELRNVLERAIILGAEEEVGLDDLPESVRACLPAGGEAPMDLRRAVVNFEREQIERAIMASDGDRRSAARLLGIGLSTLYRKLEE